MSITERIEAYEVGDEVTGSFRCAECDLLVTSPLEADGKMILPVCPLCRGEGWRRAAHH